LRLNGWRESVGVAAEIDEARRLGLPVVWLDLLDNVGWCECDEVQS
jgi:hypothetical protein